MITNWTKKNSISLIATIIIYVSIIGLLSITENSKDAIFIIALITIMISSFLSLFKINLEKIKYFIWLNIVIFFVTYIWNAFLYNNNGSFINHLIIALILLFFTIKHFKNKTSKFKIKE